jgi:hypothetical protein
LKKVIKIDTQGLFVEDVLIQDNEITPNDCIEVICPDGFYRTKWNGNQWVEGLTIDVIKAITNKSIIPNDQDRLNAIESAISALMGV